MSEPALVSRTRVRLVDTRVGFGAAVPALRGELFRPFVVGPAILQRPCRRAGDRSPWRMDELPGGRLLPAAPRRAVDLERVVAWRRAEGLRCRIGVALVSCCDLGSPAGGAAAPGGVVLARARPARGAAIEIYGWALLYRGRDGDALVDAHDEFDDLPAYSTAPAELADRAEHLAARGIASRPVALVTAAEDFIDGDPARNRFFPAGAYRGPADLRRLF